MLVPGSANPLLLRTVAAAAAGGISRSIRLNAPDSAHLSRTPASAGNRKTWTWAGWVKRSGLGAFKSIFGSYDGSTGSTYFSLIFTPSDTLRIEDISVIFRETTQVFRDASAWYHLVLSVDTTNGTANDRIRLYVNGSQVTAFNTTNNPSSSADLGINGTYQHGIGRPGAQSAYYQDGYLADIYFIDGQALTPSSFTETDATTGQLIPKAYTGSYGTNGFHLEFADNSAATATTLGKDTSGNGNNWTPNNLSVTAGAGNDSLVDVPSSSGTDTGVGGEVRGNYCTLNPLAIATTSRTYSNGNLDVSISASNLNVFGSIQIPTSGKWYWEFQITTIGGGGFPMGGVAAGFITGVTSAAVYLANGDKNIDGTASAYGATYGTSDIIGVAVNVDSGTITFYKNGSSQGAITFAAAGLFPVLRSNVGTDVFVTNFGQRPFAYTAPSGFKALCTANLPAPLVTKPSTVMDVVLYTGTGSALTPTSTLGFNPDLVWIKSRSAATDHALYDSVRGVEKRLESNNTDAEVTSDGGVTAFNTAGFSVGTLAQVNTSSATYAGWCWDAGSSTVTNTQGSISSQVRANASAGFSIVTYTGTGSAATVGHGLGVAPSLIIAKQRNGTGGWLVYHKALGATQFLTLSTTNAAASLSVIWNNTEPTSSVFSIGSGIDPGQQQVSYCFAPVAGYSSFGSYTGNGSSDGPFVFTGMRPRWLLVKRTSSTGNWNLFDTSRSDSNLVNKYLLPNDSGAEFTFSFGDILSNGFKLRDTSADWNASGATYVYAAFAEAPLNYARAR